MESYSWKIIGSGWTSAVTEPDFACPEPPLTSSSPDKEHAASSCAPRPGRSPRQTSSRGSGLTDRRSSFYGDEVCLPVTCPFGPHFAPWKYRLCLFSLPPDSLPTLWKQWVFLIASFSQAKLPSHCPLTTGQRARVLPKAKYVRIQVKSGEHTVKWGFPSMIRARTVFAPWDCAGSPGVRVTPLLYSKHVANESP